MGEGDGWPLIPEYATAQIGGHRAVFGHNAVFGHVVF